jgi:hypothetical protein
VLSVWFIARKDNFDVLCAGRKLLEWLTGCSVRFGLVWFLARWSQSRLVSSLDILCISLIYSLSCLVLRISILR